MVTKRDLNVALKKQSKTFKEEIENAVAQILESMMNHVALKSDLEESERKTAERFDKVESRLGKIELDTTDIKRDVSDIKADFVTGKELRDLREELKN